MTAFDDLSLLRSFVCIVECGSISAGARRLRISQPTLSRQLRTLEELCSAQLIRRDTHQMNVTEAGQRLMVEAKGLLTHAEDVERRLRDEQMVLSGHLRLFATVDCGQFIVTRLISQFLLDHPKVTASLALNNRPLHMMQEGCDVGILPGKITDESVIVRPAGSISLCLAAAPSVIKSRPAVKSPADLNGWPWVALAGSQFWGAKEVMLQSRKGAEQSVRIRPVLVSEGVTSVREAVRAGLGVSVLPDWLIKDDLAAGRLERVLPLWRAKDLQIHVVYAGQRLLPARVSAFIDYAVTFLHNELKRGSSLSGG
ncbi:MAG TPA: LysR family transcriptional regulator [Opitutaceae bacterium]|nr:LysR family transcriptional regulator [Opitutaceae bacterium]